MLIFDHFYQNNNLKKQLKAVTLAKIVIETPISTGIGDGLPVNIAHVLVVEFPGSSSEYSVTFQRETSFVVGKKLFCFGSSRSKGCVPIPPRKQPIPA